MCYSYYSLIPDSPVKVPKVGILSILPIFAVPTKVSGTKEALNK